jgi:hypothetical protein
MGWSTRNEYVRGHMTTPAPKKLNTLNIRLTDDQLTKMRAYAAKNHRSLSNMIQAIIAEWLEDQDKKN